MSKEWLEFFGGMFVFLGAMVPVVRGLWRLLRRKLSIGAVVYAGALVAHLVLFCFALVGFFLEWNPLMDVSFFFIYLLGQMALFLLAETPIIRLEIVALVMTAVTCLFFREEGRSIISLTKQQASPTPTPIPISN
jgi:hypothetical protein